MANFGEEKNLLKKENKEKENTTTVIRDREEKLRLVREKQNEERQKKLEELKAQALAAQKYREQKEEERKRRIEELKSKETDRRQQVEERKKAIWEAEKERREYILKKNQEREARIDTKRKNERSSSVFAFGSSTPRLLNSIETTNVSPSVFWNHRRATSITNVAYTGTNLTRRSSERDLSDVPKKRATSASGLDRKNEDDTDSSSAIYRSVARRKTDLMPTVPSPRSDRSFYGSRSSLGSLTPRTPGLRSGEATPGGSIATSSRPGSAMSNSICVGVIQRKTPRKPRPVSIAGTGVTVTNGEIFDIKTKQERPPLPSRASLSKSSSVSKSPARSIENIKLAEKKSSTSKSSRPSSRTSMVSQSSASKSNKSSGAVMSTSTIEKSTSLINTIDNNEINITDVQQKSTEQIISIDNANTNKMEEAMEQIQQKVENIKLEDDITEVEQTNQMNIPSSAPIIVDQIPLIPIDTTEIQTVQPVIEKSETPMDVTETKPSEEVKPNLENNVLENADMNASFMSKSRITTEEEAKAALAERRRLAREEAERQAELERLRIEEEQRLLLQKQMEEEEEQRRLEEEAHRLAELQRKAEEERLAQAIEEARKRDEEERLRKEEETKQKLEREEAEKKAREEAERQRIETAERLKKEEKEREERRKRVEAIMARTRAKGGAAKTNDSQNNETNNESVKRENQNNINATITTTTNNNTNTTVDQSNNIQILNDRNDKNLAYENSVTEKENTLLGSFTINNIDNINNAIIDNKFPMSHENGKLANKNSSDIILENQNGHQDFSITNIKVTDGKTEIITDQLIDFTSGSHSIDDLNNKSNNNNNNNNNTTLVTSDSQENREVSFL